MHAFSHLGIEPTDNLEVVKKAFRARSRLWHLDRKNRKLAELDDDTRKYLREDEKALYDARDKSLCETKFNEIASAWQKLSDQDKLNAYFKNIKSDKTTSEPEANIPEAKTNTNADESIKFAKRFNLDEKEKQYYKKEHPAGSESQLAQAGNVKVFIPVYISSGHYDINSDLQASKSKDRNMPFVNAMRFTEKGFDWAAITEIVNGHLKKSPFVQVGILESEAAEIVEQHSWWKHVSGYFIIQANIPLKYLSPEKLSERDVAGEHVLDARHQEFFQLGMGTTLNEADIDGLKIMGWRPAFSGGRPVRACNSFWDKVEEPMISTPGYLFLERMKRPFYDRKTSIKEARIVVLNERNRAEEAKIIADVEDELEKAINTKSGLLGLFKADHKERMVAIKTAVTKHPKLETVKLILQNQKAILENKKGTNIPFVSPGILDSRWSSGIKNLPKNPNELPLYNIIQACLDKITKRETQMVLAQKDMEDSKAEITKRF